MVSDIESKRLNKIVKQLRDRGASMVLDLDQLTKCIVTESSGKTVTEEDEVVILSFLAALFREETE